MPRLRGYLVIPFMLNFLVGLGLYFILVFFGWQGIEDLIVYLSQRLDTLIANLPSWLGFLEYFILGIAWLLKAILLLISLIITGLILTQVGVILGSPWYGQFSEELEKICTGKLINQEVGIIRDIIRAVLFEIKKLGLIMIIAGILLLFNLLPGIGFIVSSLGGIITSAIIVCLDFFDPPLERRRLSFREKLFMVFRSLPASASFSLVCLVLISIPIINLVTIPICIGSGTLFYCDRLLPLLLTKNESNC